MATFTIYSVLMPLFYCTKLFGLTPFQLGSDGYQNNYIDVFYSLLVLLVLTIGSYISVNFSDVDSSRVTSQVMSVISRHLSTVSLIACSLLGYFFKNKIMKNIDEIATADRNMNKYLHINVSSTYRKTQFNLALASAIITAYLIFVCILNGIYNNPTTDYLEEISFVQLVANYIKENSSSLTTFVNLQFCSLILVIRERYKLLNDKLKIIIRSGDEKNGSLNVVDFLKIMEKVKFSHNRLEKLSRKINHTYTFQLLLIIAQTFIATVLIMFYFMKYLVRDPEMTENMKLGTLVYHVFYFGHNIGQLFGLVFSCSSTVEESEKSRTLIYRATIETEQTVTDQSQQLDLNIKTIKFSLQGLDTKLEFSACNLFEIDKNLLFSIAGAITTYCVIVLQFELNK